MKLAIGGRYNWKNQPERLIYIGMCEPHNGRWHQFEKIGEPGVVWCEVLDNARQLARLEETVDVDFDELEARIMALEDLPAGSASRAITEFSDMVISLNRTEVKERDVTYVQLKPRSGDGSMLFERPKGKALKKALKRARQRARG